MALGPCGHCISGVGFGSRQIHEDHGILEVGGRTGGGIAQLEEVDCLVVGQ
jgi:hypothetical protein